MGLRTVTYSQFFSYLSGELDQTTLYPMATCPAPCGGESCWPACEADCCSKQLEPINVPLPMAPTPPPPPETPPPPQQHCMMPKLFSRRLSPLIRMSSGSTTPSRSVIVMNSSNRYCLATPKKSSEI